MPYPQKQNIFLPVGGLATSIDDKLLPVGRVIDLENCYVKRTGPSDGTCEAIKRFGTIVLPTPAATVGPLATHQNALLEFGTPARALATPTSTAWTTVTGDFRPGISFTLTKVASNAAKPQLAIGGGFFWLSHANAAGTVLTFYALDTATGHQAFVSTLALSGGATLWSSWRSVYVAGRAVFCALDNNGTITYVTVNPAAMTSTSTTSATAAAANLGDGLFDAFARGSVVALAFQANGGTNLVGIDFDPIAVTKTSWTLHDAASANVPIANGTLSWVRDYGGSGELGLLRADPTQGLRTDWAIPTSGATRQDAFTYVIDAAYTANIGMVAAHTTSTSTGGDLAIVYDKATNFVNWAAKSGAGVTTGLMAAGSQLRSRTWSYNGDGYVVLGGQTAESHYVVRIPVGTTNHATPLAVVGIRQGGSTAGVSSVAQVSATQFATALNYFVRFDNANNPDAFGVQYATFTHQTLPQSVLGVPREALGSTFVPGGQLAQYDGTTFLEAGFVQTPDTPQTPTPSAGGGLTASSTYWYRILYSRMDAQGRLWRSAVSVPVSGATGVGQGTLTIACPTLKITGYDSPGEQIEIYRGVAGDELDLHKVGVVNNDPTTNTVNFADTVADSALDALETIYADGGVLENDAPPGLVAIVEAQSRTWGVAMDDPQALWYTKEHALGKGLEWSEEFVLDIRDAHGPMRALSQVDDRPIAFKDDAVYAVTGQGPDVLGAGGSYTSQLLAAGIGCNNAQAICETRDGVIFRSTSKRAGFWLLDRGLTLTFIGAPVQRYDTETITGAAFLSTYLQARFFTASGRTLVYDLVTGLWSTFTGQQCASATPWAGVPVFLSSATGHVLYEDQAGATLTDDGMPTTMLVGWPWLQVNEVRGYQRFWRMQPTGEVQQASVSMLMKLYANLAATSPIKAGLVLAPVGTLIDAELRFSRKLNAVRPVITDGGSTTGILKLSGVTVVVGARPGLKQQPVANRAA